MTTAPLMRLIGVNQSQLIAVRQRVKFVVGRLWDGMPGIDRADIEAWVRQSVPVIEAAQAHAATLTDMMLAAMVSQLTGKTLAPTLDGTAYVGAAVRKGVPTDTVMARSGVTVWRALKSGGDFQGAVAAGRARAVSSADTQVMLAQRAAEMDSLDSLGAPLWRRALTGRANCGLCIAVSTRPYPTSHLRGIHPGCDCTVVPVIDGVDAAGVWNRARLEDLKGELTGGEYHDRAALRSLRFGSDGRLLPSKASTTEHGELGYVLTPTSD